MSRNHGRCPMKTRAIVFSLIMILVSVAGCAGGQDEASLNEQIDDLEGELSNLTRMTIRKITPVANTVNSASGSDIPAFTRIAMIAKISISNRI